MKHSDLIGFDVMKDIDTRIRDWLSSGGKDGDPYIQQQFRYAEMVANHNKKKLEEMENE